MTGNQNRNDQIAKWFNTSVFTTNALGTYGTGRRGQLRNPGMSDMDFSLFKSFAWKERARLQFRAECFNFLNHPNLGAPSNTVTSPTFGRITTALDPRIMQLALKVIF
jgi:hypothetical protein